MFIYLKRKTSLQEIRRGLGARDVVYSEKDFPSIIIILHLYLYSYIRIRSYSIELDQNIRILRKINFNFCVCTKYFQIFWSCTSTKNIFLSHVVEIRDKSIHHQIIYWICDLSLMLISRNCIPRMISNLSISLSHLSRHSSELRYFSFAKFIHHIIHYIMLYDILQCHVSWFKNTTLPQ